MRTPRTPHRTGRAGVAVAGLVALGVLLTGAVVPAGAAVRPAVPASATFASLPATLTTTSFSTPTAWKWVQKPMLTSTGRDQFAQATVAGATTVRRNGGFVLRKGTDGTYAQVSFSGTRYQVRTYRSGQGTVLVDKPWTVTGTGTARVELRGSTLTATWAGKPVSTDTLTGLGALTGTGTGLVIWQDTASAVGITAATSGTLATTTTVAPAPAPAPSTTTWTAPTLVNPIVWTPSATNRQLRAPADRDVLVKWPSTPIDVAGGIELNGGRNVVSTGGVVRPSKRYFPAGVDDANKNRCLYLTGHTTAQPARTVHIEGLHCAGPYVWEGINLDSRAERGTLTVQLKNITVDQVNVDLPGTLGKHYGGDAFQTWNGPHRLRIDGFRASNLKYQGFFLQPVTFGSGPIGQWQMHNIQLTGSTSGSGYLLWLAADRRTAAKPGGIAIDVKNVRVTPSPGKTADRTVHDRANDWWDVTVG